MQTKLFKLLLTVACLCSSLSASAYYDFEVNGIYYVYIYGASGEVVVTSGNNSYSGSITIPSTVEYNGTTYSVTGIGSNAFYDCSSLTSINIPENVTSIGKYAFYGCSSLASINIPENVTRINDQTFYNCSSLTSITLPVSVTSIGDYAFYDCSSLSEITLSENIEDIGWEAFEGTPWYENQTGIIYIGNMAYRYKGEMPENTSIRIKEGTKTIYNGIFYECPNLTKLYIPKSVTSIGTIWGELYSGYYYSPASWTDCSNLTEIVVEEGNPVYDSRNNCNAIIETSTNTLIQGCNSTTIPEGIIYLGHSSFWGCHIKEIEIPASIKTLDGLTYASLEKIVIHGSPELTVWDDDSDPGNTFPDSLKSIYCLSEEPPVCGSVYWGWKTGQMELVYTGIFGQWV